MIRLVRDFREDDIQSQDLRIPMPRPSATPSDNLGATGGPVIKLDANTDDLNHKCSLLYQSLQYHTALWDPILNSLNECKGGIGLFQSNCKLIEEQWSYLNNLIEINFGGAIDPHYCDKNANVPLYNAMSASRTQICEACPNCDLPPVY